MAEIMHIAEQDAWQGSQPHGEYCPASLATEGFIHLSQRDQVLRVANALYRGVEGLVLLIVDTTRLKADLRYEAPAHPDASPSEEVFPHLYGPLNTAAVIRVLAFKPDANGTFSLPPQV